MSLFDQPNGAGNVLSTGNATQQIVVDQANTVTLTFDGVVASIALSLKPSSVPSGTPAKVAVTVAALDADGNTIVGPGTYAGANGNPVSIDLTDSDTSGATTLSPTKVTAPSMPVTLSYDGGAITSATITASATGTAPKTATLAITTAAQHLYVASADGNAISVYAATASGNAAPVRVIAGPATHLSFPDALAFDAAGDLLVAESTSGNAEIDAFAPTANGNVAPLYTIVPSTGNGAAQGLAVDSHGALSESFCGTCFFTGPDGVATFTLSSGGGTQTRTLEGGATGISAPYGIAYDAAGNLYVANNGAGSVGVFAPAASGNVAPARTIVTGITSPSGLAFDASNDLFVSNGTTATASIPVFAPAASSPARTLSNAVSDVFAGGPGIAVDAAGDVFVPSESPCAATPAAPCAVADAIAVYAPGGATPARIITGASTGLDDPNPVVLDGAGNVYAINRQQSGKAFVTIYAASSNGNVPPARTVQLPDTTGSTTIDTLGIAAAADGTLYAVDSATAIGSFTTALDVFGPTSTGPPPTRTVSPPAAGATFQQLLGLDAAQDVYVLGSGSAAGGTEVFVYAPGATSLLRTLSISAFTIAGGGAVAANGTVYVTSFGKGVAVYAPGASGNAAPARTILVSAPSQLAAGGFAVDGSGTMYASAHDAVWIYPPSAGGSTPPSAQIVGASPGLNGNLGLWFDATGNLYVANRFNHSVLVYAPNATTPMRTLVGPATLLVGPSAAALGP
ncbi:MAG TPA: hypothetical protein VHT05_00460 [Candidatus Elarobacter sp.]|nr:hypothetical protein [Candidatus Elarobacter sp.]